MSKVKTPSDRLMAGSEYQIHHGDCIEHLREMPHQSVDHAVFSPPFPAVYAYSDSVSDLGNSEDLQHDAKLHFSFFFKSLLPVMKPGRAVIVHCTQIAVLKRTGGDGLFDFRGMLIRLAQRAGFIYEYDWLIRVSPQAQAIRTHSHELQFAGLEKDRANCRGALGMYLIKLQTPGENSQRVTSPGEVTRDNWIDWAEPCWRDIVETDTLNVEEARDEKDTRHVCPMQLGIYERCIRLFSNPGEVILDPFAGIGSCGFVSLGGASPKTGKYLHNERRFYGIELKPSYFRTALRNCERGIASRKARQKTLFDALEGVTA